ncbi:MAG: RNA-splicing ligase RtcB [Oligoflexia bacterium]|nr:MAG: RNA-splicing ligase RtcB [Oligoflexia bacterium]
MELSLFEEIGPSMWQINPIKKMKVPAVIYASRELIQGMDNKVYEQLCNVATLPGIVRKAYAMPDAHWGYGFPIGGVAAFDPDQGGIVSAGGVGFDISCGVRLLHTGMKRDQLSPAKETLAELLYEKIPSGVGSQSHLRLNPQEMDEMLLSGARWAIKKGFGSEADLEYIEERGFVEGAKPEAISEKAKERQKPEMGTLGSGNHYLEVQEVTEIFHHQAAETLGLQLGDIVVSIHCGSRGLGHQIGTEYLRAMLDAAKKYNITLPDRELACAPIQSEIGDAYLGAMRGAINCAMANRQIITQFTRNTFGEIFPHSNLRLVYDVSHNTCKSEWHKIDGENKRLFVHRKGATRAFGPGHAELPEKYKKIGQPVFIGGSMGVGSYVLVGTEKSESLSFSSACHGAGRALSRTQAMKTWSGPDVIRKLKEKGVIVRSGSYRGVAEEAPDAYKDLHSVVNSAEQTGLALKVAHLCPHICIKG